MDSTSPNRSIFMLVCVLDIIHNKCYPDPISNDLNEASIET